MSICLKDLMENDGTVCPSCGKRHFGLLHDYIADDAQADGLYGV